MLSKKTKYAVKALILLGKNMGQPPLQIARIAETENIPKKFLEQIVLDLRNAGFLHSTKGPKGGYSLSKNPEEIYIIDVLRITNGPIAMVPCASHKFYHHCDECKDEITCGIREVFVHVHDEVTSILSKTTISDIINRENTLIDNDKILTV